MKIAIISVPSRKEKDARLVEEAKKVFEQVEYATIDQLRLGIENKLTIKFNGIDLNEFNVILAIPTSFYKEFFYTLGEISSPPISYDPEKLLVMYDATMLSNFLSKNGIRTRKFITVTSSISFKKLGLVKFPVTIRLANKKVQVTNKNTLKDVITLFKKGEPITIEKPIKADKIIWIFTLPNQIVTAYQEIGKDRKVVKRIDEELKEPALKINKLLNLEYSLSRFILHKQKWIFDRITLAPDFKRIEEITGENISRLIVERMMQKGEQKIKIPILQRIINLLVRR